MDWGKLLSGLGNAGDILSGKESYNSIKRGNMADTTANRQITSQDTQAAERNNLEKLMQKIQIVADTLSQGSQQSHQLGMQTNQFGFTGKQNQADRDQSYLMNLQNNNLRRDLNKEDNTFALGRTMAPLEFAEKRLNDIGVNQPIPESIRASNPAFAGLPPGTTWAQLNFMGQGGQAAGNFSNPFMMHGGGYSSYLQNQGVGEIMDRMFPGQGGQRAITPGVGQVSPGGVPMTGPAAPSVRTPITPRSGNY
jgi:hypothetical protein